MALSEYNPNNKQVFEFGYCSLSIIITNSDKSYRLAYLFISIIGNMSHLVGDYHSDSENEEIGSRPKYTNNIVTSKFCLNYLVVEEVFTILHFI